MAYKQKKPTFFGSALKQYYSYENESKTEISKEEFIKQSNSLKHVGAEGKAAIDLWKSSLMGKTGIDEIDAMSKHDKQNEYSRVLKKYQTPKENLTKEEMDNAKEVSPTKSLDDMILSGAGKIGTHKYTSGSRSYRGTWDVDTMMNKPPKKDDLIDKNGGDDKDNGGGDGSNGGGIKKPNFGKLKFPKFKKNTNSKQKQYITTACPVFGEPGSANYRAGMLENKRSMSKADWKIFKRQQRDKHKKGKGHKGLFGDLQRNTMI